MGRTVHKQKKVGHLRHNNDIIFVFFGSTRNLSECKLHPAELVTLLKQRSQRKNPKVFILVNKKQ